MKKMIFGLLATVLCASFSVAQGFEESVALFPSPSVKTAKGYAQALELKSFSAYKLLPRYAFNGIDFTDDGKYNDVKAGDGIYTSAYTASKEEEFKSPNSVVVSDKFKSVEQLGQWKETNRPGLGVTVHCRMRIVYTGTTWLGFGCSGGCIELYDCEITLSFGGGGSTRSK